MSIVVSRDGKEATPLERSIIKDEAYLQQYILDNPETLPLDQIQRDIRPMVLLREFPTSSGTIDALATHADGRIRGRPPLMLKVVGRATRG